MLISLTSAKDDDGRRLDRILRKALPDLPLSAIHRLLRQGLVYVNGDPASATYRVLCGQTITVNGNTCANPSQSAPLRSSEVKINHKPLEIIFEGGGLLFLNKPAGLVVHGRGSLEELVRSYMALRLPPSLSFKPGPLHRLDRPSSGLIVFSTNIEGARFFSAMMRERKIKKEYLAIVEGTIEKTEVWQDGLVRDAHQKKTFTDEITKNKGSKMALTRVKPLMANEKCSLILAEIETGRTHQIRSQADARGHPLLGDKKYGGKGLRGGFLLHAWRLEFPEEVYSCGLSIPSLAFPSLIEAPLPKHFKEKIRELFGEDFD
jgi:23S rRNA pseudouridine955/2504/2580 synthase